MKKQCQWWECNMTVFNYLFIGIIWSFLLDLIVGIVLFGLLVYGIVTGFDDGNGYDKFR